MEGVPGGMPQTPNRTPSMQEIIDQNPLPQFHVRRVKSAKQATQDESLPVLRCQALPAFSSSILCQQLQTFCLGVGLRVLFPHPTTIRHWCCIIFAAVLRWEIMESAQTSRWGIPDMEAVSIRQPHRPTSTVPKLPRYLQLILRE